MAAPSSKACEASEAHSGSPELIAPPRGDEHPGAQELLMEEVVYECPLPQLVDEASRCYSFERNEEAAVSQADPATDGAEARGQREKTEELTPEDQVAEEKLQEKGEETSNVVAQGDELMEDKGDDDPKGDGGRAPRWSRLASELGTGCRPFLGGEDAAAAAAAALLKRLGGAKANSEGGLPAIAPFAEQLPSPLFCRPLPLFCRSRRVRFDEGLNTEHEVTPYAEVYGRHPRHFVFDRRSRMIAAAPGGFVSLNASAGTEEEPDDEEDDEAAAAECGPAAAEPTKEETAAHEVVPLAKGEARLMQATKEGKDDCEQQFYQDKDEDEECLFVLPASLEEALEVTSHAPAKTASWASPDSNEAGGSNDENWEAYLDLAAAWSAYDHDVQPAKGDHFTAGCAASGMRSGFTDTANLTSAFIFSPLLTAAW